MIDRHQARILTMQALCQLDANPEGFLDQLDDFLADESADPSVCRHAGQLVRDTWNNLATLDALIQAVAEHWDVQRMASVDRNTIRVALCELYHRPDVPPSVVINEAVEIGKTFGTGESGAFINGILDAILKKRTDGKPSGELEGSSQPEA